MVPRSGCQNPKTETYPEWKSGVTVRPIRSFPRLPPPLPAFRRKHVRAEPDPHMGRDLCRISSLPPRCRAVIDADRFPKVAGFLQSRQENPACGFGVKAGVVAQPMPNMMFGPARQASDARQPHVLIWSGPNDRKSVG